MDLPTKRVLYREDGSVQREEWLLNGGCHREDGPAIIYYKKDLSVNHEVWYLNSERHREDGPAVIFYREDGSVDEEYWYLNGDILIEEEVEDLKLKLKIDKLAEQMLVGEL